MTGKENDIVLIIPQPLVAAGLTAIISQFDPRLRVRTDDGFTSLINTPPHERPSIVILDPLLIMNRVHEFNQLRHEWTEIQWIGMITGVTDPALLSIFDHTIHLFDASQQITTLITRILKGSQSEQFPTHDTWVLSERETEVLKRLAEGSTQKEIADQLHISIHTVITHRKNISQKTGIRSQAGLTIYALSKGIIALPT